MIETTIVKNLAPRAIAGALSITFAIAGCSSQEPATSSGTGGTGGSDTTASGAGGHGGEANTAPGAPADFTAELVDAPFGVALAWKAPGDDDIAGYLVVRSAAPAMAGGPEDGESYEAGDTLPNGAEVIYAGADLTATDPKPLAETNASYAVYALDAGGLYGQPATAELRVALPPQIGQIEIATPTTTPSATVKTQPLYLPLSVSASYDSDAGELTLSIEIENQVGRMLFNPKLAVDEITAGDITVDGVYKSKPTAYYGPNGLAPSAKATRDIVIKNVGSDDPLVLDVSLYNHPAAIFPTSYSDGRLHIRDTSGAVDGDGTAFGAYVTYGSGYKPDRGHFAPGVFSPDGRYLYTGHRNRPAVLAFDTTTWKETLTSDLSVDQTGIGHASAVVMSPDAKHLYTLVTTGAHHFRNAGDKVPVDANSYSVDLVRLDRSTLVETGRVALTKDLGAAKDIGYHPTKGGDLDISPDGKLALAPILGLGTVFLIDLEAMKLVDIDSEAPGDQGFDVSANDNLPRRVTFGGPDGKHALVVHSGSLGHGLNDATVSVIDVAAKTMKLATPEGEVLPYGTNELALPNGTFCLARKYFFLSSNDEAGLLFYDPVADEWRAALVGEELAAARPRPSGGLLIGRYPASTFSLIDPETLKPTELDGKEQVPAPIQPNGHNTYITPF